MLYQVCGMSHSSIATALQILHKMREAVKLLLLLHVSISQQIVLKCMTADVSDMGKMSTSHCQFLIS